MLSAQSAFAAVRLYCRTAFDTDYFYLAADVEKQVLKGTVSAPFGDPYQDDCIAVYLGADPSSDPEGNRRVEMAVSVAGGAQLYRGKDRTPLKGPEDFRVGPDGDRLLFKYRLRPKGQLNAAPDPANGFTVEIAIPWNELGGPPKAGEVLRFNVAVFSTVEGEPPIASVSPDVKSREDAPNPQLWGRIVFTDAPVASISGVPGGFVCSRVFNIKPTIDGAIAEGEWSRVTAFTFEEGGGSPRVGMGTAASARSRASAELKPGVPPGRIVVPKKPERPAEHVRQQWPRLLFARYRVDYQSDTRKPLPLRSSAMPSGQTLLATHPMDGTGPWFTYDRLDWHRIQLSRMREAGVDVAAVTFRPSREGRLALTAMAGALQAMDASNMDHPTACLWLDASGMKDSADLVGSLCSAVRTFHDCMPAPYVCRIPLLGTNGPGSASVVVIDGLPAEALAGVPGQLRARYRNETGDDLMILTSGVSAAGADGVVPDPREAGVAFSREAAVAIGSVYAGAIRRTPNEHPLAKRTSSDYRNAWKQIHGQPPDWLFVESWNDHASGSEITPTVEYGLEYLDITRAFSLQFSGKGGFGGSIVAHNAPTRAASGATYTIRFVLRNQGATAWSPDDTAVMAAWRNGAASQPVSLLAPVEASAPASVVLHVGMPREAGLHELVVYLVKTDRKGIPRPPSPATRSELGAISISVLPAAELPAGATLVSLSLTRAVETQSGYPLQVTLRNDGPTAWLRGATNIHARLLERADESSEATVADMAAAAAALNADVPSGAEVSVTIPTWFAHPDGRPFRFSSDTSERYLLRFDVDVQGDERLTLPTAPREIEMVEADMGPQFFNDYTPSRLPAERRVPVVLGVRNRGPQTWLKDQVAVGYHWYYLDGVEAVWEDELVRLKADVPPGTEVADVGAWITAPPHDGTYWLVWDLRVGDVWVSTLPGVRTYETRVSLVQVINGRLKFVDLKSSADVRAVSDADMPDRQGFDGNGNSFAAELTPPYTINVPTCATLWLPEIRSGTERSRQISFQWLRSSGPSSVRCRGQEIAVAPARQAPTVRKVHLLAASVKAVATVGVTLRFADNSEQFITFPVSVWTQPPANGEVVAHAMPYSRTGVPDAAGPPVSVFWYTINVRESKKLTTIAFTNAPDVRILAITTER